MAFSEYSFLEILENIYGYGDDFDRYVTNNDSNPTILFIMIFIIFLISLLF